MLNNEELSELRAHMRFWNTPDIKQNIVCEDQVVGNPFFGFLLLFLVGLSSHRNDMLSINCAPQRLVTRSFDVFFDLHQKKLTVSRSLWRHWNECVHRTMFTFYRCAPNITALYWIEIYVVSNMWCCCTDGQPPLQIICIDFNPSMDKLSCAQ